MVRGIAAALFLVALTSGGWGQQGSRSYIFTGVVKPEDCKVLPQSSFEIHPSLSRSGSADRLSIKCAPIADGTTLLTLTFLLTDTPPALERGQSRSYSFRWGAKIEKHLNPMAGEFTHDGPRCIQILSLFSEHASAKDRNLGPQWIGGCYHEDRWGLAMELTLTEATR